MSVQPFRYEDREQAAASSADRHPQAGRPGSPVLVVDHQLRHDECLRGKQRVSYGCPCIAPLRQSPGIGDDHEEGNGLGNREEEELTKTGFRDAYHVFVIISGRKL